jgi:hypothetical protein
LDFFYEGIKGAKENAAKELQQKLKKPYLWYGVGCRIITPLGQVIEGIIEVDSAGNLVIDNSERF